MGVSEKDAAVREVTLVVPVWREAENIQALAERIDGVLSPAGIKWSLLLVDDDSQDGSEAVVETLAQRLPVQIHVRREGPRDLSLSVMEGIWLSRTDHVVVMDADLSHPPERIPALLEALDDDCDIVVGSRYVAGGSLDPDWGRGRQWNSRIAVWLARPLTTCSDPMAGFFAIDRRRLSDLTGLRPIGYKIALELIVRGRLRVREVPIAFADRQAGESKLTWRQQLNYLRHLRRLYQHRFGWPMRFLFFGLVGASGFIIDLSGYLALQWAGMEHRLARALSFWGAVSWNWWFNRVVTFSERERRPRLSQWAAFLVASLVGFSVNWGSYVWLTSPGGVFPDHLLLAFICGVALGGIVNFLFATYHVYRSGRAATENQPA